MNPKSVHLILAFFMASVVAVLLVYPSAEESLMRLREGEVGRVVKVVDELFEKEFDFWREALRVGNFDALVKSGMAESVYTVDEGGTIRRVLKGSGGVREGESVGDLMKKISGLGVGDQIVLSLDRHPVLKIPKIIVVNRFIPSEFVFIDVSETVILGRLTRYLPTSELLIVTENGIPIVNTTPFPISFAPSVSEMPEVKGYRVGEIQADCCKLKIFYFLDRIPLPAELGLIIGISLASLLLLGIATFVTFLDWSGKLRELADWAGAEDTTVSSIKDSLSRKMEDLIERIKRCEEDLEEILTVFSEFPLGVAVVDEKFDLVFQNEAFERSFGSIYSLLETEVEGERFEDSVRRALMKWKDERKRIKGFEVEVKPMVGKKKIFALIIASRVKD